MAERKKLPTNQGGVLSGLDAMNTALNTYFDNMAPKTVMQVDYGTAATQEQQDQNVVAAAAQLARSDVTGTTTRKKKGASATLVTDGLGVTERFNQLGKKTLLGE